MKRIVNGRLYDTDNCLEVGSVSRERRDPVTGAEVSYRETLYREVQLKSGESIDSAYQKGAYSYHWDETKVDTRRGAFVLVVRRGYSDDDEALFMVMEERDARMWLEAHRPSDVETYERFFGPCESQFSANGRSGLATETISRLETEVRSQKWNLEAREESIREKDELIGRQASQIEDLRRKLDAMEAGL